MREVTTHKVKGINEELDVFVVDEPGKDNTCHAYNVRTKDMGNSCYMFNSIGFYQEELKGVNGITDEVMLAIVEDRLSGLQAGQCACIENAIALAKVREALDQLKKRIMISGTAQGVQQVEDKNG